MTCVLWWIRRDLRLTDNTALHEALHAAETVIPVYILDDRLLRSPRLRGPRIAWMLDGLRALDADLRADGARLILRQGDPVRELMVLCRESGAEGVYFNRDYSPFAVKRDAAVKAAFGEQRLIARDFKDGVLHEADEVTSKGGRTYEVYTPYRRVWSALPKPPALPRPTSLRPLIAPEGLRSLPIPDARDFDSAPAPSPIVAPGEINALRQLTRFTSGQQPILAYAAKRDLPATEGGTSLLSPYLRWGMLSPRTCYWAAMRTTENSTDAGVQTWIGELIWREFNYQVLAKNPRIVRRNFRSMYDAVQWEFNPEHFAAWREGRTGFPIIDAAMRQLNTTGWMHNRLRMIVASFLCKDLLIDWRRGEEVFMQRLLDGDVANNVGGWQWTAGTGTDAAPYFRIFNPTSQADKFDPDGEFMRRWVPEAFEHATGDYPAPIVDHAVQRERALRMYGAARISNNPEE